MTLPLCTASSWFHRSAFSAKASSYTLCSTSAVGAVGEMAKITSGFMLIAVSVSIGTVRLAGSTSVSDRLSKGSIASMLPR